MIKIDKGDAPQVLIDQGVDAAAGLCEAYDREPGAYDDGSKKLAINDKIYGHSTVRDALEDSHHGKCAFCEVKIPKPYAPAHVEHWRPKGSVTQVKGEKATKPGYYWLAYEWDNLLLACLFCNSSNKGVQFPLEDPTARALNHHFPLAAETPLLLKPDVDDPSQHIEFIEEIPRGISPQGKATIKALGLDRLEHTPRDDLIATLRFYHDYISRNHSDTHPEIQAEVLRRRTIYEQAGNASEPFSAMAAAFIAKNPLPGA